MMFAFFALMVPMTYLSCLNPIENKPTLFQIGC